MLLQWGLEYFFDINKVAVDLSHTELNSRYLSAPSFLSLFQEKSR